MVTMKDVDEIVEREPVLPGMPKELNRHVKIAINHLNKRRETLLAQRSRVTREIEEIDAALLALE